jgi:hypothetical protein
MQTDSLPLENQTDLFMRRSMKLPLHRHGEYRRLHALN